MDRTGGPLSGCCGYSPLVQVTRENVAEIRLAWSRALMAGTQEVTPLAYDGVLYMPNGSDVIQAIDAASGDGGGRCRPRASRATRPGARRCWPVPPGRAARTGSPYTDLRESQGAPYSLG